MNRRALAGAVGCALIVAASLLAGVFHTGLAHAQSKASRPLKIVVYGGSGMIGSRIVNEAAARGHQVMVVDRSPRPELAPTGVHVMTGDVFDLADVSRNISGQDVLVTAIAARPTPTRDFYVRLVKTAVAAQRAQVGTLKTRLMVVGGAGSLTNAEGKRIVDTFTATVPEAAVNEIRSMAESLDYLRTVKDTSWTFFSPAGSIAPGQRTGKFRVGRDALIVDDKGQSRISAEDYAVAMLDEIENPKHVNSRFTVGY
jgi:uncharacterized protein